MPTNNFLQFATADGSDAISDATYASLAARLVGFQNGIADPGQVSKALRQGSAGAAVLGQIIVDHLNIDANDDGNTANQKANLRAAIAQMLAGVYFGQDTSTTANVLTVALDPAPVNLNNFRAVWVRVANNNTGPVTLNLTPMGAKTVTRRDGSPLQARDIRAGQFTHIVYDSQLGQFVLAGAAGSEIVTLPTADVTIYVSPSGNDTAADGTMAKPFLTPAAAAMFASRRLYFAGYKLIIQLAATGNYAAPGVLPAIGGQMIIQGDPSNPSQYVLSGPGPSGGSLGVVFAGSGCNLQIQGLTVQNTGITNNTVGAGYGGFLNIANCILTNTITSANFSHISASSGGGIGIGGSLTISGSMSSAISAGGGSGVTIGNGVTVTVAGNPNYSAAFCNLVNLAYYVSAGNNSYSGSATGLRYNVQNYSVISTAGGGANYFPGSVSGVANNGIYT